MTILYSQRTCKPATDSYGLPFGEMKEATAWMLTVIFPNKYFYYVGEPDILPVTDFDPDFFSKYMYVYLLSVISLGLDAHFDSHAEAWAFLCQRQDCYLVF